MYMPSLSTTRQHCLWRLGCTLLVILIVCSLFLPAGPVRAAPGGVCRFKDIWPGEGSSNPQFFTNVNGMLFFIADAGTTGLELWKSDCTAAGTTLVKDIRPGATWSELYSLTAVNGLLFFTTDDGSNGGELWKSDGTEAGTVLVKDIWPGSDSSWPESLINVNGTLFFHANDGSTGTELWKSDGTAAGTVLVKDIWPGSEGSSLGALINVNGTIFFRVYDESTGGELWKSDGTEAGTVLVMDIWPGPDSSWPDALTNVNGTLFFAASDGSTGTELWKSDGTEAGTVLVKDIWPGGWSSWPGSFTNINDTLFFAASDDSTGYELWKSDGTEAGTVLVKDIWPGGGSSWAGGFTAGNDTLFFVADNGSTGSELWQSDGTEAGTVLVKDIRPGSWSSGPESLTDVNGILFFTAYNDSTERELWQSDGTEAGTVLVKDIWPGPDPSGPGGLIVVNGTLFFAADDGIIGRELWTTAPANDPPETTITSAPPDPSSDSTAIFEFTSVDDVGVSGFACSLDGAPFTVCTSPQTYSGLTNGSHTFQVRAIDTCGNVDPTPASHTWTIVTRTMLLSFNQNVLGYRDEDILAYNLDGATSSLLFDGSDVGLGNVDVDAFAFANGTLLVSVDSDFKLKNFGDVDDSDILQFVPFELGSTTRGTWQFYVDGSDVGLNESGEDIDAIDFDADGNLVISVNGSFKAPGASGTVKGNDHDLFKLNAAQFGPNTSGTWQLYFDGSDVNLSSSGEDLQALWADHAQQQLYFAVLNSYSLPNKLKGDGNDILICAYASLGDNTSCTFTRFWDGDTNRNLKDAAIDGLSIGAPPVITAISSNVSAAIAGDDTVAYPSDDADDPDELDGEEVSDEEAAQNIHLFLPLLSK